MIEEQGNIWQSKAKWICVTTNSVVKSNGELVMGAGIAKEANNLFPGLSKYLGEQISQFGNNPYYYQVSPYRTVVSFPTKWHWKDSSDIELIKISAYQIFNNWADYNDEESIVPIVALPRPGCSHGGLSWEKEVKPVLDKIFISDNFIVYYE